MVEYRLSEITNIAKVRRVDLPVSSDYATLRVWAEQKRAREIKALVAPLFARLAAGLKGVWTDVKRHQHKAKTIAELHRLDDHVLRDIGLTRDTIARVANDLAAREVAVNSNEKTAA